MVVLIQVLKAIHQATVDGGDWRTAALLVPLPDPCGRAEYGASMEELELVAAYRKSIYELGKAQKFGDGQRREDAEGEETGAKGAPKGGAPGGKGK